jgi:superfamily II DNA/RNA helicase
VLVRRFMTDAVTHNVDSSQSPVAAMRHHVLHLRADQRLPVLVELASAPGRTLVFTRTKHRAKALTRQLVASGVPAVELHGNLGQSARTRNLGAFATGTATVLVATDIAARGIHVDDVTLVIHADPPVEHKAYLHRSGRTARAGAVGTVVTLMTDEQLADVRDLTRKAGITATTTKLDAGHPLLAELAPGERSFTPPPAKHPPANRPPRRRDGDKSAKQRGPSAQVEPKPETKPRARGGQSTAHGGSNRRSGTASISATTRAGARRRTR